MPRTRRDELKRTIAQAHGHITDAMDDFYGLHEQFEPHHPDLAEGLKNAILALSEMQKFVDTFCDIAWGIHPEDYANWRQ